MVLYVVTTDSYSHPSTTIILKVIGITYRPWLPQFYNCT